MNKSIIKKLKALTKEYKEPQASAEVEKDIIAEIITAIGKL